MHNFFRSKFFIILAIITVVILILMAVSTVQGEKANFAKDAALTIVSPIEGVFSSIGEATDNFFGRFRSNASYRTENEALKAEIQKLEEETRDFYEVRNENARLLGLLSLKENHPEYNMVGARVVAKDPGTFYSVFKIDKGTNAGIHKNDVVLTDKGLVGYIYEVGTNWSTVLSIIDTKSTLGAIIERTGDTAMIEGGITLMNEGKCHLFYLSKDAEVAEGDFLETSGLGGIYPEGLYIGKIKSLSVDAQGLYYEATVEPAVDFSRISEVMVIRK